MVLAGNAADRKDDSTVGSSDISEIDGDDGGRTRCGNVNHANFTTMTRKARRTFVPPLWMRMTMPAFWNSKIGTVHSSGFRMNIKQPESNKKRNCCPGSSSSFFAEWEIALYCWCFLTAHCLPLWSIKLSSRSRS